MLEQPGWLAKQYQIYALIDPRDQTICYVGVSNDVKRRFYEHLQCVGIGQQEKRWIKELGQLGLSPLIQILETIQNTSKQREVAYKRERYWINEMLRRGHLLLNFSVEAEPVRLKIREIAEAKKINMSKLSRMADVNYNTIRAIWDNEMKDVTVSTLEKIARALKVDVAELIEVLPDEEQR